MKHNNSSVPLLSNQENMDESVSENKTSPNENLFERNINLYPDPSESGQKSPYQSNYIITSRYTIYNFIFYNLWEQFHVPANLFFLLIGALQAIPPISPTGGFPSMYTPLSFILIVSAIRAGFEDYKRHQMDYIENNREYLVYKQTNEGYKFVKCPAGKLEVGNIVKVFNDQNIPADLFFIGSSHEKAHAFINTASLDGETSLKIKVAFTDSHEHITDDDSFSDVNGTLSYEGENKEFDSFRARFTFPPSDTTNALLDANNLLLKGVVIKNTQYIYGIVVYTGSDTKIRQNCMVDSSSSKNTGLNLDRVKKSSVMKRVDRYLVCMLCCHLLACLFGGIISGYMHGFYKESAWYLHLEGNSYYEVFVRFWSWFILMAQIVPISLLVSSEVVKSAQAFFINSDIKMYDPVNNQTCTVQSSMLNEDLGQVEYIFSDKTGTLTQNRMMFRVCVLGSQALGSTETEISTRVKQRKGEVNELKRQQSTRDRLILQDINVCNIDEYKKLIKAYKINIEKASKHLDYGSVCELDHVPWNKYTSEIDISNVADTNLVKYDEKDNLLNILWRKDGSRHNNEKAPKLDRYLVHMAISNTIIPVKNEQTDDYIYQSSSPDELALCQWAKLMGYKLIQRNPTKIQIVKQPISDHVEERTYNHLATLDFNGRRKRVTLIYSYGDTVEVMCKGADSVILSLISPKNRHNIENKLNQQLVELATNGLRTMIISYAVKKIEWFQQWEKKLNTALSQPEKGEEKGHTKGNCTPNCCICKTFEDFEMDADMKILGATAIEDKLQALVPESIENFLRAGIKVWMLTGDKKETAKNIGLACNLINPDMENIIEDGHNNRCRLIEISGQFYRTIHDDAELLNHYDNFELYASSKKKKESLSTPKNTTIELNYKENLRNYIDFMEFYYPHHTFEAYWKEIMGTKTNVFPSKQNFIDIFRRPNFSFFQCVAFEIFKGLEIAHMLQDTLNSYPIGMLLEGSAFAILQSAVNLPNSKKSEFSNIEADDIQKVQDDFFELASLCRSVIACRLTPYQKAKIVSEVEKRTSSITLAIGDGANDEQMIKQAHIGVGITGLEGSAAARASDYAINQFFFLHTLLFVHGWWSYLRNCKLVHYIFYKAALTAFCMFWFGTFSSFSGQQFFNDGLYQLYNIIFTSAPIVMLSIWDQELSSTTLENSPIAYKSILRGQLLNGYTFAWWMFQSLIHTTIIFYIVSQCLAFDDIINSDGYTSDLFHFSSIAFTIVDWLATFRICFEIRSFNSIVSFFVSISFIGYFLVFYILTQMPDVNPTMYNIYPSVFHNARVWLVIIFALSTPLIIALIVYSFRVFCSPKVYDILREREILLSTNQRAIFFQKFANFLKQFESLDLDEPQESPPETKSSSGPKPLMSIPSYTQSPNQPTLSPLASYTDEFSLHTSEDFKELIISNIIDSSDPDTYLGQCKEKQRRKTAIDISSVGGMALKTDIITLQKVYKQASFSPKLQQQHLDTKDRKS